MRDTFWTLVVRDEPISQLLASDASVPANAPAPQIEFPLTTEIQENAFRGCTSLSDVVLPAVKFIAANAFFDAFATSSSVLELANLTELGSHAFSRCKLAGISAPALTAIPAEAFSGKSAPLSR